MDDLPKPVDDNQLHKRIRQFVDHAEAQSEPVAAASIMKGDMPGSAVGAAGFDMPDFDAPEQRTRFLRPLSVAAAIVLVVGGVVVGLQVRDGSEPVLVSSPGTVSEEALDSPTGSGSDSANTAEDGDGASDAVPASTEAPAATATPTATPTSSAPEADAMEDDPEPAVAVSQVDLLRVTPTPGDPVIPPTPSPPVPSVEETVVLADPTSQPVEVPEPTAVPPVPEPTDVPPTVELPTATPTEPPTATPSAVPTAPPLPEPSVVPTEVPSASAPTALSPTPTVTTTPDPTAVPEPTTDLGDLGPSPTPTPTFAPAPPATQMRPVRMTIDAPAAVAGVPVNVMLLDGSILGGAVLGAGFNEYQLELPTGQPAVVGGGTFGPFANGCTYTLYTFTVPPTETGFELGFDQTCNGVTAPWDPLSGG